MLVANIKKKRKATKTSEKTRIRFVCVCEGGGGRVFCGILVREEKPVLAI